MEEIRRRNGQRLGGNSVLCLKTFSIVSCWTASDRSWCFSGLRQWFRTRVNKCKFASVQ